MSIPLIYSPVSRALARAALIRFLFCPYLHIIGRGRFIHTSILYDLGPAVSPGYPRTHSCDDSLPVVRIIEPVIDNSVFCADIFRFTPVLPDKFPS